MKLTDIQYSQILVYCFSKNIPFDSKENYENRNDDFINFVLNINNPNKNKTSNKANDIKTYIMFDINTGYYKIGKSINPLFREKTLQSEKPTINLIHTINQNIERDLHKTYNNKRIRGEWFALTENDIKSIMDM